jgi:curli biogenesis system outer membrane secretion channel CsgG
MLEACLRPLLLIREELRMRPLTFRKLHAARQGVTIMRRFFCVVGLLLLLAPMCAAQQPPQKKRVAVLNFDYGTVRTYVVALWGTDQDVGKGVSDMLVQRLVQNGTYSVVERNALDKILAEQNFSNSDRADSATAAKIGKVLGVDAVIIGTITQFGRDDKSKGVGGLGSVTGRFGIGGVQKKEAKAVVAITARMINTSTAEILAAATGNGESDRTGASLVGGGGSSSGFGAGGVDMTSSNFGATILGEATNKAVDSLAMQLEQSAANIPAVKIDVAGLVADVSGNTLILNVGRKSGVKVGDKLEISREARSVKDPSTGKVLRVITDKVGDATVTDVDDNSATATFAGSGAPKVGDIVKNGQ